MTTRRHFIAGLLATAATGVAQDCPAQPATVFADGFTATVPVWWFNGVTGQRMVRWSELDPTDMWAP